MSLLLTFPATRLRRVVLVALLLTPMATSGVYGEDPRFLAGLLGDLAEKPGDLERCEHTAVVEVPGLDPSQVRQALAAYFELLTPESAEFPPWGGVGARWGAFVTLPARSLMLNENYENTTRATAQGKMRFVLNTAGWWGAGTGKRPTWMRLQTGQTRKYLITGPLVTRVGWAYCGDLLEEARQVAGLPASARLPAGMSGPIPPGKETEKRFARDLKNVLQHAAVRYPAPKL